jgi:hypothetical protein
MPKRGGKKRRSLKKSLPKATSDSESAGEGSEYEVEKIVNAKKKKGTILFQVKWKGFKELTWEQEDNLGNCAELIYNYRNK